ncbi:transcriptional antiterminator [Enterococcus florum]|uniref:DNA translocase FtsK n=1 Tax=Enterococcus florum TaxID=2480627 RepID=A0A4P5P8M8_9ENTE|nr:sigma 54-interacting transcriptional regulator [Enterococcus florum]GCF92571.1 transcriptional antiterminator [Enterococcus florum]
MKRSRYVVLDHLKELVENQEKVTTNDVAESTHLSRNVVTTYLSQLLNEGLVKKSGTRPVFWQPNNESADAFSGFIGAQGSLEAEIAECKAAVTYPPKGFPILITGESGVGKSYLASLIHQYAVEEKVIEPSAKFVTLNCADYANNPELLSSVLFGYRKGAFTGAEKDTEGLVQQADGGFLFLDEVHRLNSENQEKLFTLLDLGQYYPLGEKEQAVKVDLRFIFATTESLDESLLRTFQRRVPMTVKLPAFHRRPIHERLEIIFDNFVREAKNLDKDFELGLTEIFSLINRQYKGNLGDVKNQVRLLCARAFMEQKKESVLCVGEMKEGLIFLSKETVSSTLTERLFRQSFSDFLNEVFVPEKIHDMNECRFLIRKEIKKIRRQLQQQSTSTLILASFVQQLSDQANAFCEQYGIFTQLQEEDLQEAALIVALFLESTFSLKDHAVIEKIKTTYPRSYYLMGRFIERIQDPFKLGNEQIDVLQCLLLFILIGEEFQIIEKIPFYCLLLSHGTMASSIQRIVNSLCHTYLFEAFDMPVDASIKEISTEVETFLQKQNRRDQEVILLFDMGSLSQMYKEIKKQSNADLMVINNLTTSMALDIGLQVQQQQPFKEIAKKAEHYSEMTNVQYFEGLSQNRNIIVSCMSGVGLSEEIKTIMLDSLAEATEIITMDYKDLKQTLNSHDLAYFANTQMILTTTDIDTFEELSIINIYDVMEPEGAALVKQLLIENGESEIACDRLLEQFLQFFTIEGIGARLQFLNPEIVIKEVQEIVEKYQQYYELTVTGRDKLNLYMHIALMIERMMVSSRRGEESHVEEKISDAQRKEFYSVSRNIFHAVERKYNIHVDDYELSLMYELLNMQF